jgi:hypothetical protein
MTTADLELYMNEFVDPTIRDLEDHPASRRHAFIACAVTFHCIDYFAHPKKSANLRNLFRNQSPDFAVVDRVAHSFKHLETGHPEAPQNQPLASTYVFERPPGEAGRMQAGLSRFGDAVGSVGIWGEDEDHSDVLPVVKRAAKFLRSKIKEAPSASSGRRRKRPET